MLAAGFVGCAISFDGYELESDSGLGASTGTSGSSSVGGAGVNPSSGGNALAGNAGIANDGATGTGGDSGSSQPDASTGAGGTSGTLDAGKAGAGGSSGSSGVDAGPRGCPIAGAPMTDVPIPMGAPGYPGTYCIDRTEVTNQQYADWLAKNPSTAGQPTYCTWNNSFVPQMSAGISNCENVALVYDPTNHPLNPVACIDWCDAYAYCKSVGKRLCGAFGGGGVAQGEGANSKTDEWVNACSAGGTKAYPYGSTYQGAICNGLDYGQAGSIAVGLAVNCVGGYGGIFDMSGNVAEWDDACNASTGGSDLCLVRGGYFQSYDSPSNSAACAATPSTARSRISRQFGFRCCFDGK
jgi:sulfatase modifying factor 1